MAEDPTVVRQLEAAFVRIQRERMAGVPILNAALHVEAIGFSPWEGHWLGILVTPWFLNLVLLPGDEDTWEDKPGETRQWVFPSGRYDFISAFENGVGAYQSCSLFSPMFEFADQASARETALAALQALSVPARDEIAADAAMTITMTQRDPVPAPALVSRRGFLTGAFVRK